MIIAFTSVTFFKHQGGYKMIKSIEIVGLFGRFNYRIATMPGGITILTGPNGFGKSTILKIISALSTSDLMYFLQLEFKTIAINFDSALTTSIEKAEDGIKIDDAYFHITQEMNESYQSMKRRSWIVETSDGYYLDRRTDERLTESELFSRFVLRYDDWRYPNTKASKKAHSALDNIFQKLEYIKKHCGGVGVISDERLIRKTHARTDEQKVIDVIKELPQKLKEQISHVYNKYSDIATSLDSTYPNRLFSAKDGINSQTEYKSYLDDVNKKFSKLRQYKLVDMTIIDQQEYNSEYATALKIYFEDFAKKYTVFEGLITKLDLFTQIINDRLMFKQIAISREKGFYIVDIDNPEKELSLSQLSSGEKQEIVLFYDLIFGNKENLLLLIDEPEISLHIAWQKRFLDDLLQVSQYTHIQAIVATHSPQIVSNHMDIQIDLGELYAEQLNNPKPN